ncbi:glycosyltransferase family 2 protein [Chelatococcus reniformis]|uniref:Glycosyl transferase n=1 Tax=Chelatococcus reniformis TaxID=1494448 RepID=A0A916X8B8_9HYPH|nr:glycosyltransferase family 2 protein [Chelatococcus reniformis]GGC54325.1 glycosyl transferase [Chelatococcus reniformis]
MNQPLASPGIAGTGRAARPRIAVLVPCFNEAAAIGKVVRDFGTHLPDAAIYVYDNNSTDDTAAIARAAGAIVRREPRQGKGYVVRRMFADVEADVYILVDGDDTYDAGAAPDLVARLLAERADFVNAARDAADGAAYRRGHRWGNRLLSGIVQSVFGRQFEDMLSGYKVLSRRFVKSFPATSGGFETETELAIHCLELRMPSLELRARYKERPENSESKLRTVRDGTRILWLIARLVKDERPLLFFGTAGLLAVIAGIVIGVPVIYEFLETHLVPRLPTAVLATSLVLVGVLSIAAGLILDMVTKTRHNMMRLAYLAIPVFDDGL